MDAKEKTSLCTIACKVSNENSKLTCKLSTPELQKRKETVLKSLMEQRLEISELKDGYAFKFSGTDSILDQLCEFIKTERACCDSN